MGVKNIKLIDDDYVAPENIGCQNFELKDEGIPKISALRNRLMHIDYEVNVTLGKYRITGDSKEDGDVLVVCVDSMISRRSTLDLFKTGRFKYMVDMRMGSLEYLVYSLPFKAEAIKNYESNGMYSDSEAVQEPCTHKSTGWTSLECSARAIKFIVGIINGEQSGRRNVLLETGSLKTTNS
jgi:hypothetical protein